MKKHGTEIIIDPDSRKIITKHRGEGCLRIFPGHRDAPVDENRMIAGIKGQRRSRAKESCVCNPPRLRLIDY